jgi:protein TonB
VDFAEQQRRPTKHLVAFSIVVLMHVVLGYALVTGLARRVIDVVKAPIETKIIEEVKPPPPPPENLPPPPKFAPPPPSFVPPPEVVVTPQVQAPTITTTQEPPPPAPPVFIRPTAPEAPPAAKVAARPTIVDASKCAPTAEDYPAAAARNEVTGTTVVRFFIDAQGKVAKYELVKSAGSSREHKMLDRVAIEKFSACHFTPGTDENGRPVGATKDVEYVWKLQ